MKITIITTGLGRGGAEAQLIYLSQYWHQRGWQVRVISLLPVSRSEVCRLDQGIVIKSLGLGRNRTGALRAIWKLFWEIRQYRPDVLLCFMFHANIVGRIVGRLARVPCIVASIRNEQFGGRWRELAERLTESLGDVTTTNSVLAARKLVAKRVISEKRIRVIPNVARVCSPSGVKIADMRASLGIRQHEFFWIAVGRLEPQKDYPTLLHAIHMLVRQREVFQLRVAGEGRLRDELEQLTRELGLTRHVRWLGLRDDVADLLYSADGLVLSSAWEGLPNVVMEALSSGLPVVATAVGGVAELVDDEKSGYLAPSGRPDLLSAAMARLMDTSSELRRKMGEQGRMHMRNNFSLHAVAEQWESLFDEVRSRKGLH